ncbi:MAG: hypothetical protein JSS00_13815 [Proteobacteria bacterium]|nr:hypothetical protein [Pseudomonadota bacterium]
MRSVALALTIGLALCAGGCGRRNHNDANTTPHSETIVAPETRPVDQVPEEEPAVARSSWRAVNDITRNVTGNLRVSMEHQRGGPLIFAFATGVTVRAQAYEQVAADRRSDVGGQSFAAVLGGDPRVDAYLYRVLDETVARSAPLGGLCGADRTRFMAVSEFVDASGRWVFKIAAFKGDRGPGSGQDPQYCRSFSFTAQ